MRKLIGSAVLIAALAGMPAMAAAQVTYGFGAGLLMPMGDYGDGDKMGFIAGAGVGLALGTSPASLRVGGSYGQTSHDGVGGNTKIIGGMVSVIYPFQTAGSVKPYVIGGVGYYNVKIDITGLGEADESKVGFGGGAGLRFPLTSATLSVEARYMNISTSGSALTFIPIMVGVSFGGKKAM